MKTCVINAILLVTILSIQTSASTVSDYYQAGDSQGHQQQSDTDRGHLPLKGILHAEGDLEMNLDGLFKKDAREIASLSNQLLRQVSEEFVIQLKEQGILTEEKVDSLASNAFGYLTEQNYEQAAALYRLAAIAGHIEAQSQYSELLFKGWGTPQDLAESLKWAISAAKFGDSEMASYLIGLVQDGRLEEEFGSFSEESLLAIKKITELYRLNY